MDRGKELFDRIKNHGVAAIEGFIADRANEELFLDFKRSSVNGESRSLTDIDRGNLARAISGFGNSEGGVVVWGVDCSADDDGADVARAKVPIRNPRRFMSFIEGAVSGCTVPAHSRIENHVVMDGDDAGYVITLIPKSNNAPHQALPKRLYYMRAGSSFVPVPHDILAGMFGRRPQPHVFPHFLLAVPRLDQTRLSINFGIAVHNEGPGIASDIFCVCAARKLPNEQSTLQFEMPDQRNWFAQKEFDIQVSMISSAGYRIPPGSNVQPLILHLALIPPFVRPLTIDIRAGAGQSPPYSTVIDRDPEEITRAYEQCIAAFARGASDDEKQRIAEEIVKTSLGA